MSTDLIRHIVVCADITLAHTLTLAHTDAHDVQRPEWRPHGRWLQEVSASALPHCPGVGRDVNGHSNIGHGPRSHCRGGCPRRWLDCRASPPPWRWCRWLPCGPWHGHRCVRLSLFLVAVRKQEMSRSGSARPLFRLQRTIVRDTHTRTRGRYWYLNSVLFSSLLVLQATA